MPLTKLFDISERLPVAISSIAIPSDISIFGDHFGDTSYYSDFAGIALKYKVTHILEIGIRFGYSGIAMCAGALAANPIPPIIYRGMDWQAFSAEITQGKGKRKIQSNEMASRNFNKFFGKMPINREFFATNTQTDVWPEEVTKHKYCVANCDGDHSREGAFRDLNNIWPLMKQGGIVIVDDIGFTGVFPAVDTFIKQQQSAGEEINWQFYDNERGFAILQKTIP